MKDRKGKKYEEEWDYISLRFDQYSGLTQEINQHKDENRREDDKRKKLIPQKMKHIQEYQKAFGGQSFRSLFTDEINKPQSFRFKRLEGKVVKWYW